MSKQRWAPKNGPRRVAIIGNGGGGKSTLSRRLARGLSLPLYHVDQIQFLDAFQPRPEAETRQILATWAAQEAWLIDGFGPLELIRSRFEQADCIVFVDFPLWRHYWWCGKRQLRSLWQPRPDIPEGCREASLSHTWKLARTLWQVHRELRPQFVTWLQEPPLRAKVIWVHNLSTWWRVSHLSLFEPV